MAADRPKIFQEKHMPQAKFNLSDSQIDFINRHDAWGFPDKSALVREALDEMKAKLAQERLIESAKLYAEDEDLRRLTEAAMEDWPS
jgi:Arc/MetJ-type ribon-helix-helix transcriptional regulator